MNTFLGLMQRQYDHVKLHVTLINTQFANGMELENDRTFDGRAVLEKYANYEFGSQKFREIHLSMRYTTSTDGFYEATTNYGATCMVTCLLKTFFVMDAKAC